eukprot:m.41007 g.41007  ORF g.41007 m.41007 type:complete len:953 (+) comp11773_c0_seq1:402-3260(+)
MDDTEHQHEACKPVLSSCSPGERQVRSPWVDRNRACEPCPAGYFSDQPNNSTDCQPVSICSVNHVEEMAPTPTSDRVCKFIGQEAPHVTCPAPVTLPGRPAEVEYPSPFTLTDFNATVTYGSVVATRLERNDGRANVSSTFQRGTVTSIVFTAVSSSNLEASCTTTVNVLYVSTPANCTANTTSVCSLQTAVLNLPYAAEPVEVLVTGNINEVQFRALQTQLPPGMTAEITSSLYDIAAGTRLRFFGTPGQSGRYTFNVTAANQGVEAILNGKPFVLQVVDCRDDRMPYDSCLHGGKCQDDGRDQDSVFACDCPIDYLPDPVTRQCTIPAVPVVVTCPCDLQLATLDEEADAPTEFWAAFQSQGGNIVDQRYERSDGRTLRAPFHAGLTTLTYAAHNARGSSAVCVVHIGVLTITSNPSDANYTRVFSAPIPETDALSIVFGVNGLLPSYTLQFELQSQSDLQSQGFVVVVTSEYDVATLLPFQNRAKHHSELQLYRLDTFPQPGRYEFQVLAFASLNTTLFAEQSLQCVRPGTTEGTTTRRSVTVGNGTDFLNYSPDYQSLSMIVDARDFSVQLVDCVNTTCDRGTCKDDVPYDGRFECQCEAAFQTNGDGICTEPSRASKENTLMQAITSPVAVTLVLTAFLAARMIGRHRLRKYHHIFISYRKKSDFVLAKSLCEALQASTRRMILPNGKAVKVKCYFDSQDIKDGKHWKKDFLNGLRRSCLFVPIVSESGIDSIKGRKKNDTVIDNVLLEYETAVKLKKQQRIAILPLFVGADMATRFNFEEYGAQNFPAFRSATSKTPIHDTMNHLFYNQGLFIHDYCVDSSLGTEMDIPEALVDSIITVCQNIAWGPNTKSPPLWRRFLSKLKLTKGVAPRPTAKSSSDSDTKTDGQADVDCLHLRQYWVSSGIESSEAEDLVINMPATFHTVVRSPSKTGLIPSIGEAFADLETD